MLINYDEIIALSYPIQLTIRIQTTAEGGLTEFAFNSNRLTANSMWTQLMQIDSHSMRIIFVVWTGLNFIKTLCILCMTFSKCLRCLNKYHRCLVNVINVFDI